MESISPNTTNAGLSYEDHLRVFLMLMNRQDKVMRSLDIVEMDIRQTLGNEHFRIDQCISYLKVGFGFSDAGKGSTYLTVPWGINKGKEQTDIFLQELSMNQINNKKGRTKNFRTKYRQTLFGICNSSLQEDICLRPFRI